MPGTLFVVATPIGNLEDITLRALRVLKEATLIAAEDTRHTAILLRRHDIRTPTVSVHEHNERQRTAELLTRLVAGDSIALVTDAGTPAISDPGARLVEAAHEAGIRIEPVPGPSAVSAALAVSGFAADRFTFLGFPPARAGQRRRWFEALRGVEGALIFFEAPHRIRGSLEDLREALGERQILVARELTKLHETLQRGWISDILKGELNARGEFTVVVNDQQIAPADTRPDGEPDSIAAEFRHLTESESLTRRDAVARLAAARSRSRQEVYAILRKAGVLG
jgi:16S rRNA (cytidine1402-2'-O)-methyltransferase